jgi:hypothetical protein
LRISELSIFFQIAFKKKSMRKGEAPCRRGEMSLQGYEKIFGKRGYEDNTPEALRR